MADLFTHKSPVPEPEDDPIPSKEPEPDEDPSPHPDPVAVSVFQLRTEMFSYQTRRIDAETFSYRSF
ncbi:MAG TPA: hypothetical protein VJ577_05630 [Burkholderiaceae bacterium]|nr:hypothetical protein [Burkholderiaceae bacterium]